MRSPRVLILLTATLALATISAPGAPTASPADKRLIDQFANPVDARQLDGHWLLVYFGYSRCPEICPAALMRMMTAVDRLQTEGKAVTAIFVTLDPEHDTPEVLRKFAARFGSRLIALTGRPDEIADAARRFSVQWQPPHRRQVAIDHGALIYLAAPDGRVVQAFYPQQSVPEMAALIRGRLASKPVASDARGH